MKKKKVLFLIESFIVGGAEKVLIDIVNHLDANLFDITVCSVYKHSVYKGYNKTFGKPFKSHIKYHYLIDNRIKPLYILFNYLLNKIPNVLYQLLIGNRYDTVIAFYEGLPTYWIVQAKLKGCKRIAWLHTSTELSQHGKNQEELDKQQNYYAQFNQIIAVSQGVADSFTRLFPTLSHPMSEEAEDKLETLNIYLIQNFRLAFGNRIMKQIRDYVPCFIACGGTELQAVDFIVAKKVLRKFESLSLGFMKDELTKFSNYLDRMFGKNTMVVCKQYIDYLKKNN